MKTELIITDDGSHTLYVPELNEHYHSTFGAIQESKHVFIEAGFNFCRKTQMLILEIGFGTGLNTLMTYIEAYRHQPHPQINYHSIEFYPLSKQITDKLNFCENLSEKENLIFNKLHDVKWNTDQKIDNNFILRKIHTDLLTYKFDSFYDLVYFDAFGPDKQEDMWQPSIFQKISDCMKSGAVLTTYSVKGTVKRALKNSGFKITKIPGPKGKREMIRAIRL